MDNNKAVGSKGIHVKMVKTNAGKASEPLTCAWKTVGTPGVIVPIFK